MDIYVFERILSEEEKEIIKNIGGKKVLTKFTAIVGKNGEKINLQKDHLRLADRAPWPSRCELADLLQKKAIDIAPTVRLVNCLRFYLGNKDMLSKLIFMSKKELMGISGVGSLSALAMRNAMRSLGVDFYEYLSLKEKEDICSVLCSVQKISA